uniref:Uncharacterized protein n=1 Tax=viral metagenome TaxID=1070528 RepID=A0A6C0J0U7_9ZZZZ
MVQTFETFAEKHIQQNTNDKDDEEFKTVYCMCFKFPWFRRKELSVSDSIRSFKNKNLNLSMRLKHTFINIVD